MENINKSIQCTVEDCKYHCSTCDYCSLKNVTIGTNASYHTSDCQSFSSKYC